MSTARNALSVGGSWLGLVELVLVFAIVLGWCLNELRQLRRHRDADTRAKRDSGTDADERARGNEPD